MLSMLVCDWDRQSHHEGRISLSASEDRKLGTQLGRLVSDSSPEVRGRALAAWCVHSFVPFDGQLERPFLWNRLENEDTDALFEFFRVWTSTGYRLLLTNRASWQV